MNYDHLKRAHRARSIASKIEAEGFAVAIAATLKEFRIPATSMEAAVIRRHFENLHPHTVSYLRQIASELDTAARLRGEP